MSDFCAEHHIEVIALYPNSTHLTQPMDVGVFKPLNTSWTNQAKDWRIGHQYAKIEKKDVAPILEKAIKAIKYGEHLKNAFKKSGIFPFNVDSIDLSRILPAIEDSATAQEQLWNQQTSDSNSTSEDMSAINRQNLAIHRLEHFENMLGSTVLNSFRSTEVWTGAKEYSEYASECITKHWNLSLLNHQALLLLSMVKMNSPKTSLKQMLLKYRLSTAKRMALG